MTDEGNDELHLLDLPSELLLLIMGRMDYMSRKNLGKTCKYLSGLVKQFESKRSYLPPESDDDEEDLFYADAMNGDGDGDYDGDDDIDDLDKFANFDQLSFGSNYDEELDDYLNAEAYGNGDRDENDYHHDQ